MTVRSLSVTQSTSFCRSLTDLYETRYSSSAARNSVQKLFSGRSLSNCGSSGDRPSAASVCLCLSVQCDLGEIWTQVVRTSAQGRPGVLLRYGRQRYLSSARGIVRERLYGLILSGRGVVQTVESLLGPSCTLTNGARSDEGPSVPSGAHLANCRPASRPTVDQGYMKLRMS
jgi:hypothetical protein